MDWLQKYIFPAEAKTVSPEFVRAGTRLAALEMIESGTTTFADMYYFEEEIAKETKAAGLRGVLGETVIQFPVADAKTPADALARAETFIKAFRNDPLITPAVAPHAIYTNDGPTLKAARELSKKYNVPTLIHVAETQAETMTAQERGRAIRRGLSRQPRISRAGRRRGPRDLGERRGHRDPQAARRRRVAQSREQHEAGERHGAGEGVSLGGRGDRARHRRRGQQQRPRHVRGDADGVVAAEGGQPRSDRGERKDGAADGDDRRRARARHGKQIGSLEPGKHADVIIVGMSAARQTPMYDPISHLVYVTRGDDVQTTIVNGKVLMRNRKVTTLDAAAVLKDAKMWAGKVREAVAH